MKKCLMFVPFFVLFLLSGCGKQAFDPETVRTHYTENPLQGQYTVTTHDSFFTEYRLDSQTEGEVTTVTILEPASVAGIKAILQDGQATIWYEEASVDALLPEVAGFAPMDVLHGMHNDLKNSIPAAFCVENGTVTLDYQQLLPEGTETYKQVTLREDTLELLSAQLYLNGDLLLALQMAPLAETVE